MKTCPSSNRWRARRAAALVLTAIVCPPAMSAAQTPATTPATTPPPASSSPSTVKPATPPPWSLSVNVNYSNTGGNTDVGTAGGGLSYSRTSGPWSVTGQANGSRSTNQGAVIAENYLGDLVAQRRLSSLLAAAFLAQAYKNPFQKVDLDLIGGVGLIWAVLDRQKWAASVTTGVGWDHTQYIEDLPTESYPVLELQLASRLALTSSTSTSLLVIYYSDASETENYRLTANANLQAAITRRLSLQMAYQYQFDNTPALQGISQKDWSLTTGLVLNFGAAVQATP